MELEHADDELLLEKPSRMGGGVDNASDGYAAGGGRRIDYKDRVFAVSFGVNVAVVAAIAVRFVTDPSKLLSDDWTNMRDIYSHSRKHTALLVGMSSASLTSNDSMMCVAKYSSSGDCRTPPISTSPCIATARPVRRMGSRSFSSCSLRLVSARACRRCGCTCCSITRRR